MARRAGDQPEAAPRVAPTIGRQEPPRRPTFDPEADAEPEDDFDADRGPELREDPSVEYLVVSLPPEQPARDAARASRMPTPPPLVAASAPSASRMFRVSATI